ncbi:BrnT family toxin [Roseovarius sp. C7]|uniref:BrnT family toxin n=1 Tax=Roseovarius sp. C7 TaxID=3398643 RepID=UPI0039F6C7A5
MFEWDEDKRLATISKHGLDFHDMIEVLAAPHVVIEARTQGEARFLAIGGFGTLTVAIVHTMRGDVTRLITARRARQNEKRQYQALHARRDPQDGAQN